MLESNSLYIPLIRSFLASSQFSEGTNAILFMKGFPLSFYASLSEFNIPHFTNNWNLEYPDPDSLSGKDLLPHFINSKGLRWGFYEDLIALSEILNDFSIYSGSLLVLNNNLFDEFYPLPLKTKQSKIVSILEDEKTQQEDSRIRSFYSDFKLEGTYLLLSYVNRHYNVDIGIEANELGLFSEDLVGYFAVDPKIQERTEIAISAIPEIKCALQDGLLSNQKYEISGDKSSSVEKEILALNIIGSYYNVSFSLESMFRQKDKVENRYLPILRKYWGNEANFRKLEIYRNPAINSERSIVSQGEIVTDIIDQCNKALNGVNSQYSDIIITAPTGAGKSLFFQIPGIYLQEQTILKPITLVICPLVALMIDQVKELNEDRGIEYATYINSSLTYEERQSRIEGIKLGRYSIVYLSPELLLAYDIHSLIGDRVIGLLVVDEAHLVTSWGRDFRVDYWFLGDHIEKLRRGSYYSKKAEINFPVLCLTATAVYGGRDDIIGDLQNSLHLTCYSEHMYIGYVRRDNICFNVRHPSKKFRSDKEDKLRLTLDAVHGFVRKNEKTIAYFPYKSQINDVKDTLNTESPQVTERIEKYYSGELGSLERDNAYNNFRESKSTVMLATKAFGMGVNISDIRNVYHYAPTGTLADYVQEIGRAARKLDIGYAITDYLKSDMHYAQTLWGLSGLRHYQIKAILKKIYTMYCEKQHRNLLFSPETFNYLFDSQSVDMKVKSGLMLLSSDLLEKYHFKVITVRPKSLFSKQYIIVPRSVERSFLGKYGKYCNKVNDNYPQIELGYGYKQDVVITKVGDIFEIDLAQLWENEFDKLSFAQFKFQFFSEGLFKFGDEPVVPNMKLVIAYAKGYNEIKEQFFKIAEALQNTFYHLKNKFGSKDFSASDFVDLFRVNCDFVMRREYILMILDLFCYDHTDIYEVPTEQWKFIERKKSKTGKLIEETFFCIRTQKYSFIGANLQRYFSQSSPNTPDGKRHITYLVVPRAGITHSCQQLVASILQLFDFASYEFIGGRNPQIFVRVNDPLKLRKLAEANRDYKNFLLTQIEDRHKRAVQIMNQFMGAEFTNDERWEIIENYFLGKDDQVDIKLKINTNFQLENKKKREKALAEKKKLSKRIIIESGEPLGLYFDSWLECKANPLATAFSEANIPMASHENTLLKFPEGKAELWLVWEDKQVGITKNKKQSPEILKNYGWLCFDYDGLDILGLKEILTDDF